MISRRDLIAKTSQTLAALGIVNLTPRTEAAVETPKIPDSAERGMIKVHHNFIAGLDDEPGEEFPNKTRFPRPEEDPFLKMYREGGNYHSKHMVTRPVAPISYRSLRLKRGKDSIHDAYTSIYEILWEADPMFSHAFVGLVYSESINFWSLHGESISVRMRHLIVRLEQVVNEVYWNRHGWELEPRHANRLVAHPQIVGMFMIEKAFQFNPYLNETYKQPIHCVGRFGNTYVYQDPNIVNKDRVLIAYMSHDFKDGDDLHVADLATVRVKDFPFSDEIPKTPKV